MHRLATRLELGCLVASYSRGVGVSLDEIRELVGLCSLGLRHAVRECRSGEWCRERVARAGYGLLGAAMVMAALESMGVKYVPEPRLEGRCAPKILEGQVMDLAFAARDALVVLEVKLRLREEARLPRFQVVDALDFTPAKRLLRGSRVLVHGLLVTPRHLKVRVPRPISVATVRQGPEGLEDLRRALTELLKKYGLGL